MHHNTLTLCVFKKKKYLTQIVVTIYRTVDRQLVNKHSLFQRTAVVAYKESCIEMSYIIINTL